MKSLKALSAILAITVLVAIPLQGQTFLTNGLVAYYPFNGNARDIVGGDNGTVVNASIASDRFNVPNTAYDFNRNMSPAITMTGSNLLRGAVNASFAWWFRQSSNIVSSSLVAPMFYIGTGNSSQPYINVTFWITSLEILGNNGGYKSYDNPSQPFTDGNWHHFACCITSNAVLAYVDGKSLSTWVEMPPPGTIWQVPQGNISLGYAPSDYYDGWLDDVRIYNRELSSDEVAQIYQYESGQQSKLLDGEIAYYPFSGNANDIVGGDNGTVNGAMLTEDRFGEPNSAFYFNVTNMSAIVSSGEYLPLGTNARTFSLWFKPDPYTNTVDYRGDAFGYGQINGDEGSFFGHVVWDGVPNLMTLAIGSDLFQWNKDFANWDFSTWHQLVLVASDGSHTAMYLDGHATTFQSYPPPGSLLNTASGPLYIGYFAGTYFNGSIDEFRAYSRALSATDVQQLYQYESGPQYSLTDGLVAYYPLKQDGIDQSGHQSNLTCSNVVFGAVAGTNLAATFNGSSSLALGTNSFFIQQSNWSWCAWLYVPMPNAGDPTEQSVYEEGPASGGGDLFAVEVFPQANVLGVSAWNVAYPSFWKGISVPAALTGTWNHIAITFTGSQSSTGILSAYLNGVLATSTPFEEVVPNSPLTCIGVLGNGWGHGDFSYGTMPFRGSIDELRFYNRALASIEVQQLYLEESSTPCVPHNATAVATVVNGFVVGATITDSGCGYTSTPVVLIQGGGGTGATATAVVTNGSVTQIVITDAGIGYTSSPSITIYSPLAIVTQPQSKVVHAYDNVSFNVVATGTAPLSYQWSFNGTNVAGATQTSFAITNVTQNNLGVYAVSITNSSGSIISSNAALSMYPFIVTGFPGAVTYWGMPATFTVQAWGTGPLSYQWFDNGVAITYATNAALTFTNMQFTNAGMYSVVVTNLVGSVTNISEQVIVNPAGVALGLYPGVTISGVVGYTYSIQESSDLSVTNSWITLTNITLQQPTQLWIDTNADAGLFSNPHRFYQVVPGH